MPAIDEALCDPALLGSALGDPASWQTWLSVLRGAFGLDLTDEQLQAFAAVTGNRKPPPQRVRELWAIVGRRAGKSKMAAALAVYQACFVKHKLSAGERGMVLVLAASQDQARVVFDYAKAFLESSPVLRQEITDTTRSEIRLKNGIAIAIHSNSFRTIRGRTLCACVFDEVAMWRDESSAMPDIETYRSVLPALLTTKGMLVGISTGYRRVGLLYQKHRDHFGQDNPDTLVVRGGTTAFNSTIDAADMAAQIAADPVGAQSEWHGGFRDDLSTFLADELIDAAIDTDRPLELPPREGVAYLGFTDAASGASDRGDAYAIGIGHRENGNLIVDLVRGVTGKYDPYATTRGYAELLRQYGIRSISGDNYGARWVAQYWRECGLAFELSPWTRSEIYLEVMALFARRVVRLPDHARMLRELRLLERTTGNAGKDTVNHGRGGHDDFCNVACGVLRLLAARQAAEAEVPFVAAGFYGKHGGWYSEPGVIRPASVPPPQPTPTPQPEPAPRPDGQYPTLVWPPSPLPPPPPATPAERQANVERLNSQPANPSPTGGSVLELGPPVTRRNQFSQFFNARRLERA
jgi:Phage Terminase